MRELAKRAVAFAAGGGTRIAADRGAECPPPEETARKSGREDDLFT